MKDLGVTLDPDLSFDEHIKTVSRTAFFHLPSSKNDAEKCITPVLASLHRLPVKARADFKVLLLTYKALHGLAPTYLSDLVLPYIPTRTLRRSQDAGLLIVPRISKQTAEGRAFSESSIFMEWSAYPCERRRLGLKL